MRTQALVPLLMLLALPRLAVGLPLISEVFYDAAGSDDGKGFVELYGAAGTVLDDFVIQGVNGSNGAITPSVTLSGVIPADGIFVVADQRSDGSSDVLGADLFGNFDFQNGPDSVELLAPDGSVLDALGYGVFAAGDVFAGEGSPAPDAPSDQALARWFANVDSDDNALDFTVALPTPGSAPIAVPEPSTATLVGLGLAGLAHRRRRRR